MGVGAEVLPSYREETSENLPEDVGGETMPGDVARRSLAVELVKNMHEEGSCMWERLVGRCCVASTQLRLEPLLLCHLRWWEAFRMGDRGCLR